MIQLCEMNAQHVTQIAALERECFSNPWSEKSVASELENELSLWLVALDGEVVAGYVGSQTVLGETDLMNIAVHPAYRRRKIAEAEAAAEEEVRRVVKRKKEPLFDVRKVIWTVIIADLIFVVFLLFYFFLF